MYFGYLSYSTAVSTMDGEYWGRSNMGRNGILGRLSFGGCSHQFSWPRHTASGDFYQVCVLCGDEYSYDWASMQRLGRKPPEPATTGKAARRWSPRAKRISLSGPVRYRRVGTDLWSNGELRNISKSGLLFKGSDPLPDGVRVEVGLEMPAEICGSVARSVQCDAQIVRIKPDQGLYAFAVRIFDYTFTDTVQIEPPVTRPHRKLTNWYRRRSVR